MTNHTISQKFYAAFGVIIVLALAIAWVAFSTGRNAQKQSDYVTNVTGRKLVTLGEVDAAQSDMLSAQRGLLLNALFGREEPAAACRREFAAAAANFEASTAVLGPLLVTERGRRLLAELQDDYQRWKPLFADIDTKCRAGEVAAAVPMADQVTTLQAGMMRAIGELLTLNSDLLKADHERLNASSTRASWSAMVFGALLLIAAGLAVMLVRGVNTELMTVAASMIEGSDQVASASSQVASTSQIMAQGASHQAASLEQTSASAEEVTSMTRQNADNSRSAADLMQQVDQHVSTSNHTIGEMVASMHAINDSSEKVSRIIKVIDEIAFQTNILALNAAVEAARAGKAGMGFAVVADEVRNLAQRSAQAARDTAGLIEESIARSKEGNAKLEEVTCAIRSITESAVRVKTLIDEVSVGSQEQARGIEQIARAVADMDKATQQNAASAEESASASEELSAQAGSMREVVSRMQTMLGVAAAPPVAKAMPVARPHAATVVHPPPPPHKQAPHRPSPVPAAARPAPAVQFSLDDFKDF